MQYIRVDANETIGMGHVMRCLSIAEEFHCNGEEVTFIISDNCVREMILKRGFNILCLYTVWNDLDREIDKMCQFIKENHISLLLVDSYFVTEVYLRTLGQYTRIAYIDDLDQFIYPVDVLINYNIYAKNLNYKSRYQKMGLKTRFLLGCQYVPLRKEFCSGKKVMKDRISSIFITSGGTDSYNVIGQLLLALLRKTWFEEFEYYVILGRFNKNRETLTAFWKEYKNIHLLAGINNIAAYMNKCDIAITAGGVTAYELCACGIPSIMYTLADNQLNIARTFSALGVIPWVGDIRYDMQSCLKKLLDYIEHSSDHIASLIEESQKMQNVVDGRGRERLVNALLEF